MAKQVRRDLLFEDQKRYALKITDDEFKDIGMLVLRFDISKKDLYLVRLIATHSLDKELQDMPCSVLTDSEENIKKLPIMTYSVLEKAIIDFNEHKDDVCYLYDKENVCRLCNKEE